MTCFLPWNLKDMTNISSEKLQKNITQQKTYIDMYKAEILKEALRFNIASLLRHVCMNRQSFGNDEFAAKATDCLIVFLHTTAFQKKALFSPTDVENPDIPKACKNLHRLMLENLKSTMRYIDYSVLYKHAENEIDVNEMYALRREIYETVFPDDYTLDVCNNARICDDFYRIIDQETLKAKTFLDFDVQRVTSFDDDFCNMFAKSVRLDDDYPDSEYGLIGSCYSSLSTPFIRYGNSYYSFVSNYSLRQISKALEETDISEPVNEETVVEEPIVEKPIIEEVQSIELTKAEVYSKPEEPIVEEETVEEPTEEIVESEPIQKPAPILEEEQEQDVEPEVESKIEPEPEEIFEESIPEEKTPVEEAPVEEDVLEEEPLTEVFEEELEPEEQEDTSFPPEEEPVYAKPILAQRSESDIDIEHPCKDKVTPMLFEDEEDDDYEEIAEEDTEYSDSAYTETDEFEYPDEFEEDSSNSLIEEDSEDVYSIAEETEEEPYTALVSPDTYKYLDDIDPEEFKRDEYLDEYLDEYENDEQEEEEEPEQPKEEKSPYAHESLFALPAEEETVVEEETPVEEEEITEEPEPILGDESTDIEEEILDDEVVDGEVVKEEDTSEEPEPEPEPVVQEPKYEAEGDLLPLLDRILQFSPSKNNPITAYLVKCDERQQNDLVRVIETARKAWLIDNKDKMFSIPDTDISIAIFSDNQDPMIKIQRRENIGAVMYAMHKSSWNSLELSFDISGQLVKADYNRISKTNFSDWEWKVVEKLGTRLLERKSK